MELDLYLTFVIATTIMIALPGPSVLLTIAHSISFGSRLALFSVAGATMGVAIQLLIVTIGLGSLLFLFAEAFEWLRLIGAAYLIYLGIQQFQKANSISNIDIIKTSKINLFIQGLIVTIFNPKSLLFIAAFLPQFIDPNLSIGLQLTYIVPTFLLIAFFVTSLWAFGAQSAKRFFQAKQSIKTLLRTTGVLMIISGLGLLFARKTN